MYDTNKPAYFLHVSSGETYALKLDEHNTVTHVCGPLAHDEQTQANLDADNFNYDPEDVAWANERKWQNVPPLDYNRLYAAAPDLLAALEDIALWLDAPRLDRETLDHFQNVARAAIAKAKGETA